MKITIAEATPNELAEAVPHLFSGTEPFESASTAFLLSDEPWHMARVAPEQIRSAEDSCYVSKFMAQEMIRRRPLTNEQRMLLQEIYAAHPKVVAANELQARLGCSKSKFAGLMGSFGRRLAYTPGFL
jgi:hypothetical protein